MSAGETTCTGSIYRRSVVPSRSGVVGQHRSAGDAGRRGLLYLHQSNTQPNESGFPAASSRITMTQRSRRSISGRSTSRLRGSLGDSVFGWLLKPPASTPPTVSAHLPDSRRRRVLGPTSWGALELRAVRVARYVVAAVNFHGSTGYGQKFTDAISQHWGTTLSGPQ